MSILWFPYSYNNYYYLSQISIFCYLNPPSKASGIAVALFQNSQDSFDYHLSPAYDLLPVNLIMPEDVEESALTLNGKKRNLNIKDFYILARGCELQENVINKMIKNILKRKDELFKLCDNSLIPNEQKEKYKNLIAERLDKITDTGI